MDMIEIQFTREECQALANFVERTLFDRIIDGEIDSVEWAANICSAWRALRAGAKHGE